MISIKVGLFVLAGLAALSRMGFAAMSVNARDGKVYLYARASTKKQVESPKTQLDIGRKYCDFHGLGEPDAEFIDPAKSGKVEWDQRNAGKDLFSVLRRGDHVVIGKLDRAFRRLKDCVDVLERFQAMGVSLHVCNMMGGAIDLTSPMGRLLVHILAAFAEFERNLISERTKDGLANRKERGVCNSKHAGYGKQWKHVWIDGKQERIKVDHEPERNVMKSIVQWRMMDNLSWEEIRQHLRFNLKIKTKDGGEWDCNRVRRAFQRELELQMEENRGSK